MKVDEYYCEMSDIKDLHTLIQEGQEDEIEDLSFQTNNQKGKGFLGDILYIVVTKRISKTKQYLVLKQQRKFEGKTVDWLNEPFDNEIHFYDTIWPTMHKVYFEKTHKSLEFIPKCLATSKVGIKRIVLENLKMSLFDNSDQTRSLDENQLIKIFQTYGIFHGISMSIKEQNPEEFSRIVNGIHNLWKYVFAKGIIGKFVVCNARAAQSFFDPTTEKYCIDKLLEYEEKGVEIICNLLDQESNYPVITHGDCWSNNLMFRLNVSIYYFIQNKKTSSYVFLIEIRFDKNSIVIIEMKYFCCNTNTDHFYQSLVFI